MKGKENHHLQAERSQRHFYFKEKKVSSFEALLSVADNQETRVDPLEIFL